MKLKNKNSEKQSNPELLFAQINEIVQENKKEEFK